MGPSAARKVRGGLIVIGVTAVVAGLVVLSGVMSQQLIGAASFIIHKPPNQNWVDDLRVAGRDFLVLGAVLTALAFVILAPSGRVRPAATRPWFLPLAAALLMLLLWLPAALCPTSASIGGERYWWLGDDAMISMRYARNLAHGNGLVWNLGEHVEGYSNFLWTLFMAAVHLLPLPDSKMSLPVLLTNVLLAIATVPVLAKLVRALGGGTLAVATTLAGYVFNADFLFWTSLGFETTLLTLFVLIAALRTIQEAAADRPRLSTHVLIAAIALVRADGIVLSCLLFGMSLVLNRQRRRVAMYCGVSLLLPLSHEIFRIVYYGDPLPNTAYLKVANWDGRVAAGVSYTFHFVTRYVLLVAGAVAAPILVKRRPVILLAAAALFYMAYVTWVGGDAFVHYRFLTPVISVLGMVAFIGIESFQVRTTLKIAAACLCILSLPLFRPGRLFSGPPQGSYQLDNLRIGLLIRKNTPRDTRVADSWAGTEPYFSRRYTIDLLGKCDRHVAHLTATTGSTKPGHNKFDYDYSLGVLKPDLVVTQFGRTTPDLNTIRQLAKGDNEFIGLLYFNPVFQRHCLAFPISVITKRPIFACDWSSQVGHHNAWKPLPDGAH